jgi:Ca2+:H+ antiporter
MGLRDRFQREQRIAHADDSQSNGATSEKTSNGTYTIGNGNTNGNTNGNGNPNGAMNNGTNGTNGTNGDSYLPTHHKPNAPSNATKLTRGIQPAGESGRRGIHPWKFLKISARSVSTLSAATNILWPFVPAAIVLHFVGGQHHVWTFATAYIGMVPAASMLGFAGQEFARKCPVVLGTLVESMFGAVPEITLFMVLIAKHNPNALPGEGNLEYVLQAAILGSILSTLLLCLGCVFIAGGIRHKEQRFSPHISEVGSGVMLVAGFALLIPSAFYSALSGATTQGGGEGGEGEGYTIEMLSADILNISHGVAIILIVAFITYMGKLLIQLECWNRR